MFLALIFSFWLFDGGLVWWRCREEVVVVVEGKEVRDVGDSGGLVWSA